MISVYHGIGRVDVDCLNVAVERELLQYLYFVADDLFDLHAFARHCSKEGIDKAVEGFDIRIVCAIRLLLLLPLGGRLHSQCANRFA